MSWLGRADPAPHFGQLPRSCDAAVQQECVMYEKLKSLHGLVTEERAQEAEARASAGHGVSACLPIVKLGL